MTFPPNTEADPFLKAVEHLRAGLPALETIVDLADIESSREMVYGRYGHSFAPEQLPNLSAEEYLSFLRFENNHHWTGINRYGSRTVRDMPILRQALGVLVDEQRPLAERYDLVTGGMVEGIGRATATPILHVAYPDRYGVWNTKVEAGLKELSIFPNRPPKMTDGQLYAEINELLLELAAALDISLWTLDNLWEWMSRRRTLASPFDKIFADRAQAEHIFDRFADAVERLGGRPDDPRFALTLPHDKTMMRLNIGNSMVIDVADQGKTFHLTALIDEMEKVYQFERDAAFRVTVKGTKNQFAVYTIPPATMLNWPLELQVIFERSMPEFGREFANWEKSNLRWAHNNEAFEALFNEEVRNRILVNGLGKNRYWRITMPSDMRSDMDDGRGDYNFWADCLRHGLAAIGFDNQPNDPQIAKFASIQPGDRVVAFLRNKQIGGAGIVTSSLDEKTEKERPPDKDYFHGGMWRRIGVDWTEIQVNVDDLPDGVRNKFLQSIVMELTEAEFTEVEKLIDPIIPPPPPDNPSIAHEFKGFTLDAFAFMRELAANNNKAWMDDNRERWRDSVLEPMRSLFTDLGPHVKSLFDPYLLPDELEITPTTGKVLARINKDWTATPNSKYHEYYWGHSIERGSLDKPTLNYSLLSCPITFVSVSLWVKKTTSQETSSGDGLSLIGNSFMISSRNLV